uniref:mRNA decay activator protein ZFP36 n=1 Tax=Latimeria chalumnae TaxID=7897 RepID=H3B7I7_LATCH
MPSDFLTPFLELDEGLCKNFLKLKLKEPPGLQKEKSVVTLQRRHSTCQGTLTKSNSASTDQLNDFSCWPLQSHWSRETELPRSSLNQIPFRVDRSVSMIEPQAGGFGTSQAAAPANVPKSLPPIISSRYKTELCRTFEESGTCKYGAKCQFAHGMEELRDVSRHPKYKTELCRTFHTIGFCPYGARCHFIHNAEEQRPLPGRATQQQRPERPHLLRHSVSFAGFPSSSGFQNLQEPLSFSRASSVSPPPSTGTPELLSPIFPEPGTLKPGVAETGCSFCGHGSTCSPSGGTTPETQQPPQPPAAFSFPGLSLLQRTSSADSLSDQDGFSSSGSLSDSESPAFEGCGRRLPIFSRLSVSDD